MHHSVHNSTLAQHVLDKLDIFSKDQKRPLDEIVHEMLEYYSDLQKWQQEQIQRGVDDIEQNKVSTHRQVFSKYGF